MKFNIGDRVRLTAEAARMLRTKATARGEVVNLTKSGLVLVKWDNFRTIEKYADHLLSSVPSENEDKQMIETKTLQERLRVEAAACRFASKKADAFNAEELYGEGLIHDEAADALDAKDALLREARAVLERCKSRVYTDEAPDYARHWDDYSLVLPETKRLLERADVLLLKLTEAQK